jgi:hypothetical protein
MACAIMSKYDRYGVDDASREMIPSSGWLANTQTLSSKWKNGCELANAMNYGKNFSISFVALH